MIWSKFEILTACLLMVACTTLAAAQSQHSASTPRPTGIFGTTDQRVPISSDVWPWSSIGRVNVDKRARGTSHCTGTLIGPRHVLTAAHCLFDTRLNKWVNPEQVMFVAGLAPGNSYQGLSVATEFIKDEKFNYSVEDRPRYDQIRPDMINRDWAIIVLKDDLNLKPIPWRSIHNAKLPGASETEEIARAGYSIDRRFRLSVHRGCSTTTDEPLPGGLLHHCDSMSGDSGSPVLLIKGDTVEVIGIHSGTVQDFKSGVGYSVIAALGVSASAFENGPFWHDPKYSAATGTRDSSSFSEADIARSAPAVVRAAWERLAADQGVAAAQYNLGLMYATGQGVPQDHVQAMTWYRLAADQGEPRAQNNLGIMYAKGEGAVRDYVQAHMWFALAAIQNNQQAAQNRGQIAARMTPAQIAKAEDLAREWKLELSKGGRQ